jgi:hypothetical protein
MCTVIYLPTDNHTCILTSSRKSAYFPVYNTGFAHRREDGNNRGTRITQHTYSLQVKYPANIAAKSITAIATEIDRLTTHYENLVLNRQFRFQKSTGQKAFSQIL